MPGIGHSIRPCVRNRFAAFHGTVLPGFTGTSVWA